MIGDVCNGFLVVSYLLYMVVILLHAVGLTDLHTFGSTWLQGGFCISNKGRLYDSHMLCFYLGIFRLSIQDVFSVSKLKGCFKCRHNLLLLAALGLLGRRAQTPCPLRCEEQCGVHLHARLGSPESLDLPGLTQTQRNSLACHGHSHRNREVSLA